MTSQCFELELYLFHQKVNILHKIHIDQLKKLTNHNKTQNIQSIESIGTEVILSSSLLENHIVVPGLRR